MAFVMNVRGQESSLSEYQVKAEYLVNFSKYVDWTPNAFGNTNTPVVIGICGKDNFGEELKKMIEGKGVNGRPFVIQHFRVNQPKQNCPILFISASEKRRIGEVLRKWGGPGVLTVGESENFIAQGGIINFALKDKKVRLQVNLEAAEKAGLKLSSKLVIVSEVVKGK